MASPDVLLRYSAQHLQELQALYGQHMTERDVPDEVLYLVRSIVQDHGSALDWTATSIWKIHLNGGKGWSPYFPLVSDPEGFEKELESQLRGLRAANPAVAEAIKRHQPYQPGHEVLGYLKALARVNKHQDFTAQTRSDAEHTQFFLEGMGFLSIGPAGLTIGAAPPPTNPAGESTVMATEDGKSGFVTTPVVDWRFTTPDISVIPTLESLQRLVEMTVTDITAAAGLSTAQEAL